MSFLIIASRVKFDLRVMSILLAQFDLRAGGGLQVEVRVEWEPFFEFSKSEFLTEIEEL